MHTITEENADVIKARALYNWTAVHKDTELSFSKGDVIIVTSQAGFYVSRILVFFAPFFEARDVGGCVGVGVGVCLREIGDRW